MKHIFFILAAFFSLKASAVTEAKVAKSEQVEVDWVNLEIKTYGHSEPIKSADSLKDAELAAWADGYRRIEAFYREENPFGWEFENLKEHARKYTRSINTFYYLDGSVRVQFENSFAPSYPTTGLALKDAPKSDAAEISSQKNTGLIIRLSKASKPLPIYQVYSEDGKLLFSSKNVSRAAFSTNLMGRWLPRKSSQFLEQIVGREPAELYANPDGDRLIVRESDWEEIVSGNEKILESARIALVQP